MEGLMIILIAGYFLILPIFLLINVIRLHKRIDDLEKIIGKTPVEKEEKIEEIKQVPVEKIEQVSEKEKVIDWETELGRKYYYWIGIFVFLLGVGLFLKYAFENKWFNEVIRIIIGLVSGCFVIWIGSRLINNYRQFSLGLFGMGISILYLSFYAANNFYHLTPYLLSFLFMVVVTIFSVILSLKYDSLFMGFVTTAGGFLTPLILQGHKIPDLTAFSGLSFYLFILNCGILALNFVKKWFVLVAVSLLFTYSIFCIWMYNFFVPDFFVPVIISFSVFFLFYLFSAVITPETEEREATNFFIILANTSAYAGFVFYLFQTKYPDFTGFSSIAIALVHTIFAMVVKKRQPERENMVLFLLGMSLIFLTLSFALHLKETYITIAWIIESLLIFWLGLKIPSSLMRTFGYIVVLCSIVKYLGFDLEIEHYPFILNESFLTGLCLVICLFLMSSLGFRRINTLPEDERRLISVMGAIAHILLLVIISREIYDYFIKTANRFVSQVALSITWAIYGGILLAIGMIKKLKAIRYFALFYLGMAIAKVLLYDVFSLSRIYRIIVFICTGTILLIVSFVYNRRRQT